MTTQRSHRTPEEASARGTCRAIVRSNGSNIRRSEDRRHILLGKCDLWPQGMVIPYHGWAELLRVLRELTGDIKEDAA